MKVLVNFGGATKILNSNIDKAFLVKELERVCFLVTQIESEKKVDLLKIS